MSKCPISFRIAPIVKLAKIWVLKETGHILQLNLVCDYNILAVKLFQFSFIISMSSARLLQDSLFKSQVLYCQT